MSHAIRDPAYPARANATVSARRRRQLGPVLNEFSMNFLNVLHISGVRSWADAWRYMAIYAASPALAHGSRHNHFQRSPHSSRPTHAHHKPYISAVLIVSQQEPKVHLHAQPSRPNLQIFVLLPARCSPKYISDPPPHHTRLQASSMHL